MSLLSLSVASIRIITGGRIKTEVKTHDEFRGRNSSDDMETVIFSFLFVFSSTVVGKNYRLLPPPLRRLLLLLLLRVDLCLHKFVFLSREVEIDLMAFRNVGVLGISTLSEIQETHDFQRWRARLCVYV